MTEVSSDVTAELHHGFAATRRAHQSELAEDYVELIATLIEAGGEARPVDIARSMGVAVPTVVKALDRLARDGLVLRERYKSISLTGEGEALAAACRARHEIVVKFLIRLGVDAATAERDAEGIEHHVSEQTLALFKDFAAR
jgi:DtxR family transcriptional regulator, manganese transport regulator